MSYNPGFVDILNKDHKPLGNGVQIDIPDTNQARVFFFIYRSPQSVGFLVGIFNLKLNQA